MITWTGNSRRWGQISRVGQLLDPLADRLFVLSTLVGLTWREILPWWLTAILLAREVFIAALLPILNRHGYGPLQVSFLGKAATFNLMYGFPLLLLGSGDSWIARPAEIVSWAFIWWGATLYWWAPFFTPSRCDRSSAVARAPRRPRSET